MFKVMDKALQQLYWACRRKDGFPGVPPDEGTGTISTNDILEALGLIRPDVKGVSSGMYTQVTNCTFTSSPSATSPSATSPNATSPYAQRGQLTASPSSTIDSKYSCELSPSFDPSVPLLVVGREATQISSDFDGLESHPLPNVVPKDQINVASNQVRSEARSEAKSEATAKINQRLHVRTHAFNSTLESTHFQSEDDLFPNPKPNGNVKTWTTRIDHNVSDYSENLDTSGIKVSHFRARTIQDEHNSCPFKLDSYVYQDFTSPPRMTGDGFLPPWPGSLEAAYQSTFFDHQAYEY
jgi:hypothetical protein